MGRIAGVSPDETREKLLNAAIKVFEQKGYEGASVVQIAEEAGLTTGSIYVHYKCKADLLVDAVRTNQDRAVGAIFERPSGPGGASTVLAALADRLVSRKPNETTLLVEAMLASRRDPELADILASSLQQWADEVSKILKIGQEEGKLVDTVSADTASWFMLMVGIGSVMLRHLQLPNSDPDEWNEFMGQLLAAYIPDHRLPKEISF